MALLRGDPLLGSLLEVGDLVGSKAAADSEAPVAKRAAVRPLMWMLLPLVQDDFGKAHELLLAV